MTRRSPARSIAAERDAKPKIEAEDAGMPARPAPASARAAPAATRICHPWIGSQPLHPTHDFRGREGAAPAGEPRAGMRARSAEEQPFDRRIVAGPAEQ